MSAEPGTAEVLPAPGPWTVDPATIGPGDVLVLRALGLGDALTAVAPLRGVRRAHEAAARPDAVRSGLLMG